MQNVQYFNIIKEPIDFVSIGDKLEDGKYKTIADMKKDVMLLVKNARTFNEPQSQVYFNLIVKLIYLYLYSPIIKVLKAPKHNFVEG